MPGFHLCRKNLAGKRARDSLGKRLDTLGTRADFAIEQRMAFFDEPIERLTVAYPLIERVRLAGRAARRGER